MTGSTQSKAYKETRSRRGPTFVFASLVAASLMAVVPHAAAETFTSVGVIEAMNSKAKTIRLRNGDAYRLPEHIDVSGLKPGQQVHVSWEAQNPSNIGDGKGGDETVWLFDASEISHIN